MEKNLDIPQDFRCPISMELMKEPVTISTGVTYERKNIEKWFLTYKKKTCPATMQIVECLDMTPNHTLMRLVAAWSDSRRDLQKPSSNSCLPPHHSAKHDELVAILSTIDSTPFKVSSLRKLRNMLGMGGDGVKRDLKKSGGVEVLVKIISQVLFDSHDFASFRACEEALGVLDMVPFSDEDEVIIQILMKPDCMKSMAMMLQRGSGEARFCAVSTFQKLGNADYNQWNHIAQDQGIDFFKSLLEIVSDENCSKASSCALQVLIGILEASKKSRLKAIEAGAVCTLIELLPDAKNRSKCERVMQLMKLLCECAEGRMCFAEHGLGIAAVSKKMLNVSSCATKMGVKILWLVSVFHTTERVVEEMLVYGAVKKLVVLLHMGGGGGGGGESATKEKVVKMFKLHCRTWQRFSCFPSELRDYLGVGI